jgi:hypothetical protein
VERVVTGVLDPAEFEGHQWDGWKLNYVFAAALRRIDIPYSDRDDRADWMQAGRVEFHALGGGWENCDHSYSCKHGAADCGYPDWEISLRWAIP